MPETRRFSYGRNKFFSSFSCKRTARPPYSRSVGAKFFRRQRNLSFETPLPSRLRYAPITYTHTHIHVYKHCITRAYVFIIISFLLFIPVRLPRCRSTEPSDAGTPFVVPAHVKIRRKYFTFRSARAPRRQRRGATSRGIHFEIRTLVRPGSGE